jgi:hypothetical protein
VRNPTENPPLNRTGMRDERIVFMKNLAASTVSTTNAINQMILMNMNQPPCNQQSVMVETVFPFSIRG